LVGDDDFHSAPVPQARLNRMLRMGGLAGGIAGGAVFGGLQELAAGRKPSMAGLVLTPATALKITRHLSQMRGAAMKIGQLMSMDAGEVLSPEMAAILGQLRDGAHPMPPKQLQSVLTAEWGAGWHARFSRFDVRPIAAASIGQVHRAQTRDGRDLAIKVQYPGVRRSIDSDVANIAGLMRLPGLVPKSVDFTPLFEAGRLQLHDEADYAREGRYLSAFKTLLADRPDYIVPGLVPEFCTENLLAMEFVDSVPIEEAASADPALRDRVMTRLIELLLREVFEFRLMQTDPNFANYRFVPATGQVVLLDFGAAREVPIPLTDGFARLLRAGLASEPETVRAGMIETGFFGADTAPAHQSTLLAMFNLAMTPLRDRGPHDFGSSDLAARLRDMGMEIGVTRDFWHVPPADMLFVQRKIVGMYLLAARLRAKVSVGALVAPWA
jgi:predicted unusual protein kinase regulating ubiquinone biosynthesis (AarF/ABC1/UbiB family)